MKFATAATVIVGLLSSHASICVEARKQCGLCEYEDCDCCTYTYTSWDGCCEDACWNSVSVSQSGEITSPGRRRKLEENAPGLAGNVVMGNYADNGIFVAMNATNFPKGITNGTLTFTIADSKDCNSDAYGSALKFPLEKQVTYEINSLGGIEGDGGWFQQSIRELQSNSTLPVSLAELVNGGGSEDGLAVYLLSSEEELLGCASMEKLDDVDKAAEYSASIFGLSQDQEAVTVKEAPSSGSKVGLFVSVFAIAAVGVAFVLGDMST